MKVSAAASWTAARIVKIKQVRAVGEFLGRQFALDQELDAHHGANIASHSAEGR